ncbi:MAG TPA: DUF5946 family protein [Chloroflexota bacterium]|nr:DUF5946 family protein [Chloroflexota bacterium]
MMDQEGCQECGASPVGGRSCEDLLHDLLERTYGAAEYGLVVACYTLQHPARQSARALEWAEFHLTQAVLHGPPLDDVRRAVRAHFDQRRSRAEGAPPRPALRGSSKWRMTISHVAGLAAGDDAERLLRWARAVLDDLHPRDGPHQQAPEGPSLDE